jgi:hypothetical protein
VPITADLPPLEPAARTQVAVPQSSQTAPAEQSRVRSRSEYRSALVGWAGASLSCTAIWAAVSISSGHLAYFWPIWVILPLGAATLVRILSR